METKVEPEAAGLQSTISAEHAASPPSAQASENERGLEFNEQTNYVPRSTIIKIFLACSTTDLVVFMDQTLLAASLTIIGNDLQAGSERLWIASGYFITTTVGQLVYGRLSDIWSRKVVLLFGLAIFFFATLASSLARTAIQLIVFRSFAGIGGGGLVTIGQTIVSDVVPLRERGKYQGIFGVVVALSHGIGPVIGGALASRSHDSWRWIFRLMLPLTLLCVLSVIFAMPLKKVDGDWKVKLRAVDFVGILLVLGGTTVSSLGLTWGGAERPWNSPAVISTLVVGLATMLAFVLWQWKGPRYPLVPLHMFKAGIVNGACITTTLCGWNFYTQIFLVPTFYQLAYGYGATKAGALLLPITITQTAFSTLSGLVVHWVGRYRECILFGWLCWAVGLGLMSTLDEHSGLGKQIGYSLLVGVGVGNTLQPTLIACQAGVCRRDMAVVTSCRSFLNRLGATFGLAIYGTLLNNIITNDITALELGSEASTALLRNPETFLGTLPPDESARVRAVLVPSYRRAFQMIFIIGAALAALGFFVALFLMPQVELHRPDDERLKEEAKKAHEEKKMRTAESPA